MQCTYWHPPQHRRLTQVRSWTWNPTTFSCRAVTEMISYNSSEQADHFTSGDLCKIRAWTHFFPSSGLSFRKKHASPGPSLLPMSMDIKHMSLCFWKVLHYLTSLLFVELLSKSSHLAKKLLSALIQQMLKLHHMWTVWISSGTFLSEGHGHRAVAHTPPTQPLCLHLFLSVPSQQSPCLPSRTASTPSLHVS